MNFRLILCLLSVCRYGLFSGLDDEPKPIRMHLLWSNLPIFHPEPTLQILKLKCSSLMDIWTIINLSLSVRKGNTSVMIRDVSLLSLRMCYC